MKKWLGKIVIMTLRNAELLQFSKSVEDNARACTQPQRQTAWVNTSSINTTWEPYFSDALSNIEIISIKDSTEHYCYMYLLLFLLLLGVCELDDNGRGAAL